MVLGKVFMTIPVLGYLIHFAKQPTGFILMVIVPSIIIAASEINIIKEEVTKMVKKKRKIKSKTEEKDED